MVGQRTEGQTRISSKHQVTIPMGAFTEARLKAGDTLRVEALGPGRVVLSRQEDLLDEFSGAMATSGTLRGTVEQLRGEWA